MGDDEREKDHPPYLPKGKEVVGRVAALRLLLLSCEVVRWAIHHGQIGRRDLVTAHRKVGREGGGV